MSFFQVKVRESGHLLGESSSGLSSIDQLTGEVPDHGSDIVCIHNCLKIIRKLLVKTVFVEKSMCKSCMYGIYCSFEKVRISKFYFFLMCLYSFY